uniref:Uncharacterized protein n=1 Tax=viral metagenome TaxID=1070528 RepID=A0A6C0I7J1_9ZZZZ
MNTTEQDTSITNKGNNSNVCNELNSIKYKSMLINGSSWNEPKSASNLTNLDKFLENEKISNSNEPWSKLDKTAKTRKLLSFAEKYKTEQNLSDAEYSKLVAFFKECLDKKKLQRVKDVVYDKETGEIKELPALHFNKPTIHFTLKNIDKRVSTIKSLAPKKKSGTAKNTSVNDSDSD